MVPTDRDLTTDDTTTATLADPVTTNTTATGATCPDCGNEKICRARRQGFDRVISLVNIYPYCCRAHTCQARFYRFGRGGN
jgi:predicted RNA-binding Zn-ribbon protein involved in translation (DUF1610 family)